MKHYLFFTAMLLTLFISCNSDNDEEDDAQQEDMKPVPVHINYTQGIDDITSFPLLDMFPSQNEKSIESDVESETIEYDGRHIIKSTDLEGSDVYIKNCYYKDMENGILDSIQTQKNGTYYSVRIFSYYDDGKMKMIKSLNQDRELIKTEEFLTYNGDYPFQIHTEETNPNGTITFNSTIEVENGNIVSRSSTGNMNGIDFTQTETYTYDDKNSPYINIETYLYPIISRNNALTENQNITYLNNSIQTQTTHTYTYNEDNLPVSNEAVLTGTAGNYTYNIEIEYEDK